MGVEEIIIIIDGRDTVESRQIDAGLPFGIGYAAGAVSATRRSRTVAMTGCLRETGIVQMTKKPWVPSRSNWATRPYSQSR
jgi:hypothetical protein